MPEAVGLRRRGLGEQLQALNEVVDAALGASQRGLESMADFGEALGVGQGDLGPQLDGFADLPLELHVVVRVGVLLRERIESVHSRRRAMKNGASVTCM